MSPHAPDDGALDRIERHHALRQGSRIGGLGLCSPENHSPPLVGDIRDHDGVFVGVRLSDRFDILPTGRGFRISRPFHSLHRRVSQNHPYPEQVQDGMESVLWSDKSFVEIRQTR